MALGLYISLALRDDLQSLLGEQQLSAASLIATDINGHLRNRLTALELVAKKIGPSLKDKVTLQAMLEKHYPMFLSEFDGGVFATRLDGIAIATVPRLPERIGVNYMRADHIASAISEGKSTISKSVMEKTRYRPFISLAVPIHDNQGRVIGALAGETNLKESTYLNEIAERRYGKSGGYVILAPVQQLVIVASQIVQFLEELPRSEIRSSLDYFIQGGESPTIFVTPFGERMLASSARIPAAGWMVAVVMPIAEAFAPIANLNQRIMMATILLTLLAVGLIWRMLKRQLSPILDTTRILTTMAETNQPIQPLPTTYQGEIGDLFAAINRLILAFGAREQQMQMRNQEMNTAKERAEESDRIKSAFLSNMVHDIRTPMNTIVGFSQLMSASTLPEKERAEYADIINSSSDRLLKTINNILDISRVETGQASIKRNAFQIHRLLQDLYLAHEDAFKQKNVELKIEINPRFASLVIYNDEQKIYRILNALLDNAYKYTEKGHVEFGFEHTDKHIVFFVKDTGAGIPKNKQELVFSKFYQRDLPASRRDQVAGLDLVLAKGLVILLGGNIWFESEEGVGSVFKFTVPFISPPTSSPQAEKPSEHVSPEIPLNLDWSKKTILIAEDDMNNYLLLRTILFNRTKVTILHAKNGHEVLESVKNNPEIALVLMDLKMPGMDGFTATRKTREFNKRIPIIAVTAYSQPEDRKKATEAGCNEFISKPFDAESILRILASTLAKA
ncbi:MAG: response regulator [Bdellovibrio sp.]|nr:response regulator [Bdellovibrio sp.]